VTVGVQGLPEKAPCTPLPEQEFEATTITESPAASQIIISLKCKGFNLVIRKLQILNQFVYLCADF
jgi:hypothetical protein